jgi:hypothetical protein
MATTFVDALLGYEYFLGKRGHVSQVNINIYLESIGHSPIATRTYTHYRNLLRHGFRSYVPINQFDVSRTLGQLQMAADRRRYSREKVREMGAMVSSDRIIWFPAEVINTSLVGFGMTMANPLTFQSGSLIWVRTENHYDIPAILVWQNDYNNGTRFGVRSFEFIANHQISKDKLLLGRATSILIVRKTSETSIDWREFYRIMKKIDELIDASTTLLYSITEIVKRDIIFAPPVILSIKYGSPFGVQLNIDRSVADVVKVPLEKLQFWNLEKERYKMETRKLEIENVIREEELKEKKLENIMREIEVIRNAIRAGREVIALGISQQVADSLIVSVMNTLNIKQLPSPLFEPGSLERGILTDRLLPAAAELVAGDDPEIEIKVKGSSSNKSKKK